MYFGIEFNVYGEFDGKWHEYQGHYTKDTLKYWLLKTFVWRAQAFWYRLKVGKPCEECGSKWHDSCIPF